ENRASDCVNVEWSAGGKVIGVYQLDSHFNMIIDYFGDTVDSVRIERRTHKHESSLADLRSEIGNHNYEAVLRIHKSPCLDGYEFNPIALIQAVNYLQSLDKEQALNCLDCYCSLSRNQEADRIARYDLNEERVMPILSLLFTISDGRSLTPYVQWGTP